jgi:sugar lactone lactonase YvrE
MARPHALLRSGFPFEMTMGMRRVTSNAVDIGFGKEQRIYVLTRGGLGTEVRVLNWDDENLGTRGEGAFTWPASLLVDENELLYVSDEAKHSVTVMDKDGEIQSTWGEEGSGDGQFNRPSSMTFDLDGNIIISDTMNHRIQRVTRDGKHLQTFGEYGDGDGQLNMPWGNAVDQDGNIYVCDWRNDRIQKFSADGEFLMKLGSSGSEHGEFDRPSSVAVDAHGDIYVCDWGNDRVQLFNHEGRYVEQFIGEANLSKSALTYVLANQNTLRLREMADLEPTRRLRAPVTVRVDSDFRLYICDFGSHRIQVYKKEAYELSEDQITAPMRNPILYTT